MEWIPAAASNGSRATGIHISPLMESVSSSLLFDSLSCLFPLSFHWLKTFLRSTAEWRMVIHNNHESLDGPLIFCLDLIPMLFVLSGTSRLDGHLFLLDPSYFLCGQNFLLVFIEWEKSLKWIQLKWNPRDEVMERESVKEVFSLLDRGRTRYFCCLFSHLTKDVLYQQLNMVTSWIDGSFIYSTSETWVNTMRSFKNGTFKTDSSGLFPPRNKERAPLINAPPAHHLKMITPERMFCKFIWLLFSRGLYAVWHVSWRATSILLLRLSSKLFFLLKCWAILVQIKTLPSLPLGFWCLDGTTNLLPEFNPSSLTGQMRMSSNEHEGWWLHHSRT